MSDYRVGDGFDLPLISLVPLSPQPHCPGLEATRTSFAADGTPVHDGLFLRFIYNVIGSVTSYQAILDDWGLLNAESNDMTVYARNHHFSYARFNGIAIKPIPGNGVDWRRPFPRNITILVRDVSFSS